jgi:hypothetical protein
MIDVKDVVRDFNIYTTEVKLRIFQSMSQHFFKNTRSRLCATQHQYMVDDDCGSGRYYGAETWVDIKFLDDKDKKVKKLCEDFMLKFFKDFEEIQEELLKIKNESE